MNNEMERAKAEALARQWVREYEKTGCINGIVNDIINVYKSGYEQCFTDYELGW